MQKESEPSEPPFLIITATSLEMQRKQRASFDDLQKTAFCSNSCLRQFNDIMVLFFRYQFERSLITRLLCSYLALIYQKFVILSQAGEIPVFSEVQNQEHRKHCCLLAVEDQWPSFKALQKSGLDTTCEEWSVYEKQLSSTFRLSEVTPCSAETELAPPLQNSIVIRF